MRTMKRWTAVILAAVLTLGLVGCTVKTPQKPTEGTTEAPTREPETGKETEPETEAPTMSAAPADMDNAYVLAAAVYPEWPRYPGPNSREQVWNDWRDAVNARYLGEEEGIALRTAQEGYLQTLMPQIVAAMGGGENIILSPVNIWLALAMTAEVTDGDTRAEILAFLHCADIDECRTMAQQFMTSCYIDDGRSVCEPANAFFLSDRAEYKDDPLKKLAEIYLASAFSGTMGSEAYDKALQDWINDHTGHLLEDSAGSLHMDPETILALASAIYLKTPWEDEFNKDLTEDRTFTLEDGTEKDVPFMVDHGCASFYVEGEHFTAVAKSMYGGMLMWFILPEEGMSAADLASDAEMAAFLAGTGQTQHRTADVHLYVPRFDLHSDLPLADVLQACGVVNAFDAASADFSPLTDRQDICITDVKHAARVKIDEEGVEAAAFTVVMAGATAVQERPPQVDFICDRPFLFAVTGPNEVLEFAGMVMDPEE